MTSACQLLAVTGGASGTSASGPISATTGIAFVAATSEFTVRPGAAGTVTLAGPALFDLVSGTAGSTTGYGKWQWKISGGSYADVSSEIAVGTVAWDGAASDGPASANIDDVKTSLTPGQDYVFKLVVRQGNSGRVGDWNEQPGQLASAVGS
jgi:hypothetical protein